AGHDVALARTAAGTPRVLSATAATPTAFAETDLRQAAARLLPGAAIREVQVLHDYDFYYYGRDAHAMLGHVEKPLPMWRVVYDNPQATWVYLDPATSQIAGRQDRSNRVSRWLFAFLHSWDWTGLLSRRPLWDVLLIVLSLGGAALSLTGVVIGWRRLGKKLKG
ncbi:PepSY domain-containing protein, partial [Achromobacter sp. AGC39]